MSTSPLEFKIRLHYFPQSVIGGVWYNYNAMPISGHLTLRHKVSRRVSTGVTGDNFNTVVVFGTEFPIVRIIILKRFQIHRGNRY